MLSTKKARSSNVSIATGSWRCCRLRFTLHGFQLGHLKMGVDSTRSAWIAAKFGKDLPKEFRIGDGMKVGTREYVNRPLRKGKKYRVFLRAFTAASVKLATFILLGQFNFNH